MFCLIFFIFVLIQEFKTNFFTSFILWFLIASETVEGLARRDGLSAMAVSVLVLMEDRQLGAIICAPSYSLFCSANLPFTDVHTKIWLMVLAQGRAQLSRFLLFFNNICAYARLSVARFFFELC